MKRFKLSNRVGRLGWILATGLVAAAWGSSGASAQTLNSLFAFSGVFGFNPQDRGGLIADAKGDLFGTTAAAGAYGDGTVFEIKVDTTTATGYASTPTTLVNFNGANGASPFAGLIADGNGNLFGTTGYGGANNLGTVFEIKVDSATATGYAGTPTILVSFDGPHGAVPYAGVIMDSSGNLFGTTIVGGADVSWGTVYEIKVDSTTATGYASTPTILAGLNNYLVSCGDVCLQYPFAGLTMDSNGNLFGVTNYGGNTNTLCFGGCGAVFEIKVDSTTATGYASTPTILVAFNGADGAYSQSVLIDAHGNLFGTTGAGGASAACVGGCGTVFEIQVDSTTATGYASTPTTLVSFDNTDNSPFAGLIADANSNLFGTTSGLGGPGFGTVFEVKTDSTTATGYAGAPTILITFSGTDGAFPLAVLIADGHGNLFGTTEGSTAFEVTGSGFVPPTVFAGTPGTPNCHGVTISTLARTYGGIGHAATSLKYTSVTALQNAVKTYCRN